jgi:hypothetical protein
VNDPETGECVRVVAPDGTPCDAQCLFNATCVSGQCTGGQPWNCDTGDACTAGACIGDSCVYATIHCPPSPDYCEIPICDSVLGCIRRFLPDGTPCETIACGAQKVCREGRCGPKLGPTPTLMAAWSFDEPSGTEVFDSSGRGHTGVLVAGTRVPTPSGGGITHTGSGILVDVPDHPDFAFDGSFTVQAWIQTPFEPVLGQQMLVFRGDEREGRDPYVLALQPDGMVHFVVMGLEEGSNATPTAPFPSGMPVQLTGVFDAEALEARLYVQCQLAASVCSSFDVPLSELEPTQNPGVGLGSHARRGGMLYQFRGILDEIRIYEGALDSATIGSDCTR